MNLAQYLTIDCLGDDDQKIAVIQEFIDRAVVRRMTGRQVERPGGDGTIHPGAALGRTLGALMTTL